MFSAYVNVSTCTSRGKLACWLKSVNFGTRLREFESQLLFLDVWLEQITSTYLISLCEDLTAVPGMW